jgi:nucleotide-binding universal stress UspA family protein
MYRKILIANDGSQGADRALTTAIQLARQLKAALHMVSVEEIPRLPTTIDEVVEEKQEANRRFDRVIKRARSEARASGVKIETHVIAGHPVPSIVEFIEREGYDLLVIGYMGHAALYNRVIGSTTDRLVELAPSQVLVVK